jgi:hypothetical protein
MQMVAAHSVFLETQGQLSSWGAHADHRQQQLQQQAIATLQQHNKPGDCWLFVWCGSWDGKQPGLDSAALAVLQVWHVEEGRGDYALWQLGEACMPTGERFFSLSGEGALEPCRRACRTACRKACRKDYTRVLDYLAACLLASFVLLHIAVPATAVASMALSTTPQRFYLFLLRFCCSRMLLPLHIGCRAQTLQSS